VKVAYTRGLHELGDGLYAYLQPDGGWGWSNAGLITAGGGEGGSDGTSLLIDTLFDLRCTREMLESMAPITDRHPIGQAMNTHGNGDHWYGNQLLPDGIPIVATRAAREDMEATPPGLLNALVTAPGLPPELDAFLDRTFRRFEFDGIEVRLPSETFEGHHDLDVGDRRVKLIELGPAHTPGDAIAYVPDAQLVFTGDLLFIEGTPVMWAGPVSNWLGACEAILALEARVLVPGHGPVTDASGVRDVERYLEYVRDQATARFEAGMDAVAAADDIDISDFADWGDPERIAVNVATIYRELGPTLPPPSPPELFVRMAQWSARHGSGRPPSRRS
jgi:glyoxylase-like metal-dependent hydrolase (beta-lactamase superfamily II)